MFSYLLMEYSCCGGEKTPPSAVGSSNLQMQTLSSVLQELHCASKENVSQKVEVTSETGKKKSKIEEEEEIIVDYLILIQGFMNTLQ